MSSSATRKPLHEPESLATAACRLNRSYNLLIGWPSSISTGTAEGVPLAPKARPTKSCWSSVIGKVRLISLSASSMPDETTKSFEASSGRLS